jgi:redox-sensitive bicupin YhaK (pirin superfamily)
MRSIEKIISSSYVQMGPNRIAQPLPSSSVTQVDPFLLLHHAGPEKYQPGENALQVDAHPHRGFDPVTFVFSGEVEHKDSLGNHSIVGPGGIQWINAGKGIVHSENASQAFRDQGGTFEIIQLWINVPKSLKYSEPNYQGFENKNIPEFISKDNKSRLYVFSGNFMDLNGPVQTREDLQCYSAFLDPEGLINLEFDPGLNVIIYQLGGNTLINDQAVNEKQLVIFKNDNSDITIHSKAKSRLLILGGKPIREPVFTYGPFVLNSREELMDAIRDYESGEMGYLND